MRRQPQARILLAAARGDDDLVPLGECLAKLRRIRFAGLKDHDGRRAYRSKPVRPWPALRLSTSLPDSGQRRCILSTMSNVLFARSLQDLMVLAQARKPFHVVLLTDDLRAVGLIAAATPTEVFSVVVVQDRTTAVSLASRLSDIPVFLADNIDNANVVISDLVRTPHKTIQGALNSRTVADYYLECYSS